MLSKRIIPCLDVDAGRVVKGVKFVEIRDAGDPVEVARRYNEEGADEIVFLDVSDAAAFVAALKERGVLAGATGPTRIRVVFHLDIDDTGLEKAITSFREVAMRT